MSIGFTNKNKDRLIIDWLYPSLRIKEAVIKWTIVPWVKVKGRNIKPPCSFLMARSVPSLTLSINILPYSLPTTLNKPIPRQTNTSTNQTNLQHLFLSPRNVRSINILYTCCTPVYVWVLPLYQNLRSTVTLTIITLSSNLSTHSTGNSSSEWMNIWIHGTGRKYCAKMDGSQPIHLRGNDEYQCRYWCYNNLINVQLRRIPMQILML